MLLVTREPASQWNVFLKPAIFIVWVVKASMETIWQIDGGKRTHSARSGSEAGIKWRDKGIRYIWMSLMFKHFLYFYFCWREREIERERERLWQEFIIILCHCKNLANILRRNWIFQPVVGSIAVIWFVVANSLKKDSSHYNQCRRWGYYYILLQHLTPWPYLGDNGAQNVPCLVSMF